MQQLNISLHAGHFVTDAQKPVDQSLEIPYYGVQKINVKMCPRRPGDASEVYASTEKAERELGWR